MNIQLRYLFPLLVFAADCCPAAYCQTSVTTQHNDLQRTGWYRQEKMLNTANVRPGSFGKLFTRSVDDQLYAQPLVMTDLTLPGIGKKNLVFLATVNNTVYAFDADSPSVSQAYWQVNLTPAGSRAVSKTDMTGACGGFYNDFSGKMGIVGTPVIDTLTNTLYVVARSVSTTSGVFSQYLHALDITSGAEKTNSPRLITAQVSGSGDGSVAGIVSFDPQKQNQRCGLLLLNNQVYIAYASHCDWGPYHGWILGYDKTTLQQTRVYNSTPDGYNGGIWMSAAGPSADENGNIYAAVGNGSVGTNNNPADPRNRSETALKLTPSGNGFVLASYFTPNNFPALEQADLDFGVTEVLLIPGTSRAMTACKDGKIYLLDRDNMGGYNASANQVIQTIDLGTNAHLRSSFAYYKGTQNEYVYSWSENALLKAFPYNRSTQNFDLGNTISSGVQGPVGNNGAFLAISSNGSIDSTAILWTTCAATGDANQSVRPGILRAFRADDVRQELWNSGIYPSDNPGNYAKFNCPAIANGKVYLATFSNQLVVYGLTGNNSDTCGTSNLALNKPAFASSVENNTLPASAAFDGNLNTRWSSQYSDPQWIYTDLGGRYDVCRVKLQWESALGRDFRIEISDDAQQWNTLASLSGNTSAINNIPVQGSGRYVRMYGTARGTGYGYSLYEFEVYGKPSSSSCATPGQLTASDIYENTAVLHWYAPGAKSFSVQYKTVTAVNWTTVSADTNFISLTGLVCGTDFLFHVKAVCPDGTAGNYSAPASFSTLPCNSQCGFLPTRWTTTDVGDVGLPGSACYDNGIFTLKGSGNDIWDQQDGFRYAFKTLLGDGEITARVLSMDNSNPWNKCGIMIRESLAPGSRHAFIALTSGNGVAYQYRQQTDGYSGNTNTGTGTYTAPQWIKLQKQGSVYSGFRSADGIQWQQVGTPVDMGFGNGSPVYAGLALTAHDNNQLSLATLDQYALSGIVSFTLVDFTGSLDLNKVVNLTWTTTLEYNIRNFVIERSTDNLHYQAIDSLPAANAGRFTTKYDRADNSPSRGINYYRLKITDAEGNISYSALVVIYVSDSNAPLLYPNPASGYVQVAAGREAIRDIRIFDMAGKMVSSPISLPSVTFARIPVYNMANGVYVVEIRTSGSVYRSKLVVKR